MGGSHSVSHFAHHDSGHRFKRVESKGLSTKVSCRMCWEEIKPGVAAYYHCQRCSGFFVHDVCFHRPQTIESHWAHAEHPSHPLTLSTSTTGQGTLSSDDPAVVCTLCAEALDRRAYAYVCSRRSSTTAGDSHGHDCHGFSAHPSCCLDVSRTLMAPELHKHELTLLSPPHRHGGRPPSTCLNPQCRTEAEAEAKAKAKAKAKGKGKGKRAPATTVAWSYQCTACNVHLCLPCRLQGEGDGPSQQNNQPNAWGGKDHVVEIFGCMGDAIGTFGRRFTCACMGNPGP